MRKSKNNRVNPVGTITVSLGEYFGHYVQSLLDTGRYSNASEVLREALREHEKEGIRQALKKYSTQELSTIYEKIST